MLTEIVAGLRMKIESETSLTEAEIEETIIKPVSFSSITGSDSTNKPIILCNKVLLCLSIQFFTNFQCVFKVDSLKKIPFNVISQACEGNMKPWLFTI